MTNNTQQLPAEVVAEIKNKATHYANLDVGDYAKLTPSKVDEWYQCREDYTAGATEYATKLHQVEQENKELKQSLTISEAACSVLNEQEKAACALLSKFISRHEAGLLPDRFIYEEIKTFLDGK
jgi:hypothetical protein